VHDFRVGLRLGCPLGVAAFVHLALTLDAPHRPLLLAISAVDAHMTWWCA
jgi:hypothetical protein